MILSIIFMFCEIFWHPGSEQPVYLALPAQISCPLAIHNNMVQKNNCFIDLIGFVIHEEARPSGTHGAAALMYII